MSSDNTTYRKRQAIPNNLYNDRERIVCIKEKGEPDRRFTYHDHESGIWDAPQELARDGTIVQEVISVIENLDAG
ncbi:MAG: hypothetical protein IJ654_09980 [Bacteroidales bacterium]|nr:hypothetical protein [Bacteroidales bacterium]